MKWIENKDVRQYIAASLFLAMVLLLIAYLTFIPVPTSNKDLITAIISMIIGGLSVSLNKLFGKSDEEIDDLKKHVQLLETKYSELKTHYDSLTQQIIDRVGFDRALERHRA
jgi:hypothetical protein